MGKLIYTRKAVSYYDIEHKCGKGSVQILYKILGSFPYMLDEQNDIDKLKLYRGTCVKVKRNALLDWLIDYAQTQLDFDNPLVLKRWESG
jgi:hypothetical protein